MRTYIFTPRERKIIEAWLRNESVDAKSLSTIVARLRGFRQLERDVELYLKAARKAKPSKAALT